MAGRAQGGPTVPGARSSTHPADKMPARAHWRRPLIAALITALLAALVIVIGYERMRDEANDAASTGAAVKRARASGPASASAAKRPPAAERSGALPSR